MATECKLLFGKKLYEIKLFGSYARGDFHDESDIDIMIILDVDDEGMNMSLDNVCKIASEIDLRFNVSILPILMRKHEYDRLKKSYGLCKNVENEGVCVNV